VLPAHRALAAIPCVFAAIAFVCSYVGNFYCDNIRFEPEVLEEHADFYAARPQSFGLWMYRLREPSDRLNGVVVYTEKCAGYPSDLEIDTAWKVARAFSCVGVLVAGFLILWQFCAPFLLFDSVYWRWAMAIFAFIGACQGLTLQFVMSDACWANPLLAELTFNSSLYPEHCSWDFGTRSSLVGTIMWFVTVLSMVVIPAPGIRPSERKFPMMVWDDDDVSEEDRILRPNDEEAEDDDDSIDSFAFDEVDLDEVVSKQDSRRHTNGAEDMTETEVSESYDDDNLDGEDSSVSDLSTLGASSAGGSMGGKSAQKHPV
jgi:hypothetical protein